MMLVVALLNLTEMPSVVCVDSAVAGSARYLQELQHLDLVTSHGDGAACAIAVRETASEIQVLRIGDGLSAWIPKSASVATLAIEVAEVARHLARGEPLAATIKVRVQTPASEPKPSLRPVSSTTDDNTHRPLPIEPPVTLFLGALIMPSARLSVGALASADVARLGRISFGARLGYVPKRYAASSAEGSVESASWQGGPYAQLKIGPIGHAWTLALRAGIEGVVLPIRTSATAGYDGVGLTEYVLQGFAGTELSYRLGRSVALAGAVEGVYGTPIAVRFAGAPRAAWGGLSLQSIIGVKLHF